MGTAVALVMVSATAEDLWPAVHWHSRQSKASEQEHLELSQAQAPLAGGKAFGTVIAAAEFEPTAHLVEA